jgi:hypothetical protein
MLPIFEVPEMRALASVEDDWGARVGCQEVGEELVDEVGGLRLWSRIAVR